MRNLIAIIMITLSFNASSREIGSVSAGGGWLTNDTIQVISFTDPDISGVTCYTTRYTRALSFNSSSNSSLSCRQTGPINSTNLKNKKRVFSQLKGMRLFSNKETQVDRFIDKVKNVIVYLSYTKSSSKNTSHSLSVVPIVKWR